MAEEKHTGDHPIEDLQDAFARIEAAVDGGETYLARLGFWPLVRQVKAQPMLSRHWAEQVGRIDRKAFDARVHPTFPVFLGNAVLVAGTAAGGAAIAVGAAAGDPVLSGVAFVASAGILSVSVHGLGHWLAGRTAGIRFHRYFLDGPFRIQPGLKTDYATYLRARPGGRAWMHAAGALATKLAPFVSLLAAAAAGAPRWATAAVLGLGVVQIVTDAVWSTKRSDWMKVRRELRVARMHATP